MSGQRPALSRREFAIEVKVQLPAPLLTRHAALPPDVLAAPHEVPGERDIAATLLCPWEPSAFPQSPDTTSLPLRRAAISPENAPATLPKPAAPFLGWSSRSASSRVWRSPEACQRLPHPT